MTGGQNTSLALRIIKKLLDAGVCEFCICPGARNGPLTALLLELPFVRRHFFFEERSAAFFALGRIKSAERPVAVLTTSGTAAGELLPATMEAHYTGLPLVLVTSDRPRRFRWTGAPQTAEQVGIFGVYAEKTIDLADCEDFDLSTWDQQGPLHLNSCFEEPLLPSKPFSRQSILDSLCARDAVPPPGRVARKRGELDAGAVEGCARLSDFLASVGHPLVIVSTLAMQDREPVVEFLLQLGAPAYLEAVSGLREERRLESLRVSHADGLLARARGAGYPVDGVLRIGGVPTLRLWRDLELLDGKIPVCSVSREPFAGLSWAPLIVSGPDRIFSRAQVAPLAAGCAEGFLQADRALSSAVDALLEEEPRSEPGLVRALSRRLATGSRVFLGNSLPIREWDLAATSRPAQLRVAASRGLNGIDGQVSTFLGFAETGSPCWALLGDLTTLYDLSAPWVISRLDPRLELRIAVINNSGGKIFERMFPQPEFRNEHALDFEDWARMWRLGYERWQAIPSMLPDGPGARVLELVPEAAASRRFWEAYEGLCRE